MQCHPRYWDPSSPQLPPPFGLEKTAETVWFGVLCQHHGTLDNGYKLIVTCEQDALHELCQEQVQKLELLDVIAKVDLEDDYEFVTEALGIRLEDIKQRVSSITEKKIYRC